LGKTTKLSPSSYVSDHKSGDCPREARTAAW
jgi:hypothetical protein